MNLCSALAAVGNGRGSVGVMVSSKPDARSAIAAAVDGAARRLVTVPMFEQRTIYQDFFAECNRTRLVAKRVNEGYGLVCHRGLQVGGDVSPFCGRLDWSAAPALRVHQAAFAESVPGDRAARRVREGGGRAGGEAQRHRHRQGVHAGAEQPGDVPGGVQLAK